MTPDILTGVSHFNREELVAVGASIKEAMSVPDVFPTLTEQKADYTEAYDAFVNSIPAPNVKNKVNEMECQIKTDLFKKHYQSLGNFVRGVAMGNEEILGKSGYPMRQKPQPWSVPSTPKNVDSFATNDVGVLLVTCEPEKHVDAFIGRVSPDRINWIENFNKSSRVVLTNVATGVTLYVQMQAKNSAGRSGWSPIIESRLPAENEPVIKKANFSIENL